MGRKIRKIKRGFRKIRKAYRIATFPIRGALRLVKMSRAAIRAAKICGPRSMHEPGHQKTE